MMTTVTIVTIEPGKEAGWDEAFQERAASVKQHPGWIGVQMCVPVNAPNRRVVIGTWENRADWEAWHTTTVFQQTRNRMDGVESAPRQEWWHEVILEEHR
jgi:heme-degrading monooxygenase HmoA